MYFKCVDVYVQQLTSKAMSVSHGHDLNGCIFRFEGMHNQFALRSVLSHAVPLVLNVFGNRFVYGDVASASPQIVLRRLMPCTSKRFVTNVQ